MIINKRGLRIRKLYRPFIREKQLLGSVSTPAVKENSTDSSSVPSEEGPLGAAAKESFHNCYYKIPLTHPFNEIASI